MARMYAAQLSMVPLRIARSCVNSASSPNSGYELVHPHLLRVPDEQRRDGGEGGCQQAGAAVVELASELVEHGDRERSGDQRRKPDGKFAVAEDPDRQPQRQVVERRLAVAVVEADEQVVQREARLVDADRLVEPDPARHGQAQHEPRRRSAPARMSSAVSAAGVRLASSRQAATRAEQLGLLGTTNAPENASPRIPLYRFDRLHRSSPLPGCAHGL